MIIKNKTDSGWEELYPKTLGNNVEMNDGKSVQDIVDEYEPSVRFGDGYDETGGKPTIIMHDRMFIMTYSTTMVNMVQNKYLRATVLLPFKNVESYNVNFNLTSGAGETQVVYVRAKNAGSFQISTIATGKYSSGYTADVDIQVIGILAQ